MDQQEEETYYSSAEAARVLRMSKRRVTQLLSSGELAGHQDEGGRWHVSKTAVHELLPQRPPRERAQRRPESLENAAQEAVELRERVETLQREVGYLQGQFEARQQLSEVAESTLKEALGREQEALDRERQRADAAELEAQRLRDELEQASRRSWWQKLFG